MSKIALKYNGKGFYPGVPAKDLNEQEVSQFGGEPFLLSTGVYDKVGAQPGPDQEPEEKPKAAKAKKPVNPKPK